MVFFTVAFTVLIWALGLGFAVSIVIFVPLFIYTVPYILWLGNEQQMGRYKDKNVKQPFKAAKDASRVYGAWIRHQKPVL